MKLLKMNNITSALAVALIGMYSTGALAHGYVFEPKSRSVIHFPPMNDKGEHSNVWPADAVEAPKLPAGNDMSPTPIANEQLFQFPPDGKLASGGSTATPAFSKLDDEKQNTYNNPMSAGPHQFKWHLPAKHRTTYFTYYITKPDWQSVPGADSRLTRAMFEDKPFCHKVYTYAPGNPSADISLPTGFETHTCDVPEREGKQKIYAVWRVRDTDNAFYQMIDVDFGGEVITKPVANVTPSSHNLSTSTLSLDGSASTGKELKYSWAVTSNADKVILENSTSAKASIRLKTKPESDFTVNVKLTVTNDKNVSDSKTVTLNAKAEADSTAPEAKAGSDFTVYSNSESRGYDLNGSASVNAEKYQWTIVSGQDIGALQVANGGEWVSTVHAAKARALIKPGKIGKVTYRLTVTAKNGKTSTDDITVTVKEAQQASDVQINTGNNQDTIVGSDVIAAAVVSKNNDSLKGAKIEWSALNHADKIQISSPNNFSTNLMGKHPYTDNVDVTLQVKVTAPDTGKVSTATKVIKLRPAQTDVKAWDHSKTYKTPCEKVSYEGNIWLNSWETRGVKPGSDGEWGVWKKEGAANMPKECK
ncbi:lytic polysaccharide monooxygenase [Enterobacter bugandensis]|uniref:lytic polysaccharide monooxygenase n=1 Tax=Enterobacter bugandensis TaxID=881260 RepID=UPI0020041700|nr:lytic polysaccharide monooxygenase [Enterobacter bugandensis]MCK6896153.1 lytic polysaccharide monooxygenase [Enterobacter bugandensis]